ncbi:T9SS type A sorting domain-containing protein [candidate division KSB1 bacterium]|nr:T9SS type A sorting domain-containing protein [candidate division KSB1 bacterium]
MISVKALTINAHRIEITITTTSDWSWLQLAGDIPLALGGYTVALNQSPNATIGANLYVEQPGHTDSVQVHYIAYLVPDALTDDLQFISMKGDWGEMSIAIDGWHSGMAASICTFRNQDYDPDDPLNIQQFSVSAAALRSLDTEPLEITEPEMQPLVFAFYYPWYGSPDGPHGDWYHWNPEGNTYEAAHEPLLGYYDSGSPELQQQHLQWAEAYGIDVFIYSWWGIDTYEDRYFAGFLDQMAASPIRLSVYLEPIADAELAPPDERPRIIETQLRYLLTNYMQHSGFFHYEDKPVIFIYGTTISLMPVTDWKHVFENLRADNLDMYLQLDTRDKDMRLLGDGFHDYNPVAADTCRMKTVYRQQTIAAGLLNLPYAATVIPGYNDTAIRIPGQYVSRDDGRFYQIQWNTLAELQPAWILITSWNEWHEGTEIEPSVQYGMTYLNITHQERARWQQAVSDVRRASGSITRPVSMAMDAFPNPSSADMHFTLHGMPDQTARFHIYNIAGQQIASLVARTNSFGSSRQIWDGNTDRNTAAPSGIYFVRVESGQQTLTHKITIVR